MQHSTRRNESRGCRHLAGFGITMFTVSTRIDLRSPWAAGGGEVLVACVWSFGASVKHRGAKTFTLSITNYLFCGTALKVHMVLCSNR